MPKPPDLPPGTARPAPDARNGEVARPDMAMVEYVAGLEQALAAMCDVYIRTQAALEKEMQVQPPVTGPGSAYDAFMASPAWQGSRLRFLIERVARRAPSLLDKAYPALAELEKRLKDGRAARAMVAAAPAEDVAPPKPGT